MCQKESNICSKITRSGDPGFARLCELRITRPIWASVKWGPLSPPHTNHCGAYSSKCIPIYMEGSHCCCFMISSYLRVPDPVFQCSCIPRVVSIGRVALPGLPALCWWTEALHIISVGWSLSNPKACVSVSPLPSKPSPGCTNSFLSDW